MSETETKPLKPAHLHRFRTSEGREVLVRKTKHSWQASGERMAAFGSLYENGMFCFQEKGYLAEHLGPVVPEGEE